MKKVLILCALAMLVACDGAPTLSQPELARPQAAVLTLAGFYFLPPIASAPNPVGTFGDTLASHLAVVVCSVANDTCAQTVASFNSSGSGAAQLRLEDQHYIVNWSTRGLLTGSYRVRVILNSTELGYADIAVSGNRTWPIKFWVARNLVPPPPPSPNATCNPPMNDPNITPDPALIAFASGRDGNGEIYTMKDDGTLQSNRSNHPADDENPAWAPDHRMIAFRSDRSGSNQVYVMNADGSNVRQVTTVGPWNADPAWSPDGRISYESGRDGHNQIYVCNFDGTETRLSNSNGYDGWHGWSPDGSRIVFTSDRGGSFDLYLMNSDGSNVHQLTSGLGDALHPSFSPDGAKVLFAIYSPAEVWTINVDGTGAVNLTNNPASDGEPSWSPDGSRIAFHSDRSGVPQVWLMTAAGSGATQLTSLGNNVQPAWARR